MASPVISLPFPLAGTRYAGLSPSDLAEKYGLNEDTAEGIVQEFGYGKQPSMKTTTYKGRGNVLGFRTGGKPTTTETVFEGLPTVYAQTAPTTPTTPTEPTEPEVEEPQGIDLTDLASKYGATSLFGGMDYIKAKEQGYTDEQILGYLRQNPQMLHETHRPGQIGGLFEQINRGEVDTSQAMTRDYALAQSQFKPTGEGEFPATQAFKEAFSYTAPKISTLFGQSGEYFGGEDLKAAQQSGFSDQEIADYLKSNMNLVRGPNLPGGEGAVGQFLSNYIDSMPTQTSSGGTSAPTSSKGTPISFSATGSTAGSEDYFGGADIRQALSQGATIEDIQRATKQYSEQGKTRQGMAPGGEFYERIMRGDLSFAQ